MAQSSYFQINPIRRQQNTTGDVQRGLQIGQEIGKLIGGVAGAVKSAQADAAANKLMNTQNAPRAALVSPGGQNVPDTGGPQPAQGGSDGSQYVDPDPDPIAVDTPPQTFTNPATGDVQPEQGTGSQQIVFPDPVLAQNAGAANAAASLSPPSTKFVPNTIPAGVNTAGTQPFSGGVAGMKLQQEFQKTQMGNQLQQLQLQKAQRDATAAQQEDAGTGRFALDAQIKQAQLAEIQARTAKTLNPPKTGKEAVQPATNIDSEPVTDQNQLIATFDTNYGKGSFNRVAGTLMEPEQIPDPKNPGQTIPNPNAPQLSDDGQTVTVGPKSKRISMPIGEAQSYAKQINTQRNKSGMPAIRVPGEDQTVGSTAANPYVAKNNLDVYSRAPADANGNGGWVRLPNGKITHLVRQNGMIVGQQN